MDAYVQIALIEKVKLIFATDDKLFLSFPLLRPINYRPAELAALLSPQTPSDYAAAADFARTVNFVPRDMVASDDGQTVLWEIYQDVLDHAEHATGQIAPEQDALRQAAAQLLYSVDGDGLRHESPAYLTYRQYRDAWFVAQQNYNAQKITGTSSDDPEIRRQWTEEIEPALRQLVDQALVDLQNIGRKSEIEAALAVLASAADSAPGTQWLEWRKNFDPNIDLATANTTKFAPTGYSPSDIAEGSSWVKTELTAAEMASLVASSPQSALAGTNDSIAGMSLEFRSVAVTRPWFDPAVFPSRIWRNGAGMEPLNDGADPPGGRLPAYVTALVLVRNIEVTRKAASEPVTGKLDFAIAAQLFTQRKLELQPMIATVAANTEQAPDAAADQGFMRLRRASFDTVTAAKAIAKPKFNIAMLRAQPAAEVATVAARPALLRAARLPWQRRAAIEIGPAIGIAQPDPAPTPPPPPPQPPPDDSISVLAFICRRLPKAPDPLPGLTWT